MTELAYRALGAENATQRTMILHGVLGRKNNWSSIARKLVRENDDAQFFLPDLRLHGDSQGFAPPHSIAAAADDVVTLVRKLGGVTRLIGHSLGSKVATVAAHKLAAHKLVASDGAHESVLRSLWLIDGTPSAEPGGWQRSSGARVLDTLRKLGTEFETRERFLTQLQGEGFSKAIAEWLAMNLQSTVRGRAHFGLDLDAVEELLSGYFDVDNWNRLETLTNIDKHLVVGADSDVVSRADQARFAALGEVHTIEGAGHWVHVDQPQALLKLLSRG